MSLKRKFGEIQEFESIKLISKYLAPYTNKLANWERFLKDYCLPSVQQDWKTYYEEESKFSVWQALPQDLCQEIASFNPIFIDLYELSKVCKIWWLASKKPAYWNEVTFHHIYGVDEWLKNWFDNMSRADLYHMARFCTRFTIDGDRTHTSLTEDCREWALSDLTFKNMTSVNYKNLDLIEQSPKLKTLSLNNCDFRWKRFHRKTHVRDAWNTKVLITLSIIKMDVFSTLDVLNLFNNIQHLKLTSSDINTMSISQITSGGFVTDNFIFPYCETLTLDDIKCEVSQSATYYNSSLTWFWGQADAWPKLKIIHFKHCAFYKRQTTLEAELPRTAKISYDSCTWILG